MKRTVIKYFSRYCSSNKPKYLQQDILKYHKINLKNVKKTTKSQARTKDGATVFHLAAAKGHVQVLDYLLAIKAAKSVKFLKDITGSTPAHDAAENGTKLHHRIFNFT